MQVFSARTPPFWAAFSFVVLAGCAASPEVPQAPATVETPDAPDEFEEQRKQAVEDSRTPEAKAYERDFYPAIGPDLANLLKKCTAEFPAEDVDSFEMVFKVDHWGEPKAILVNPVTDVSQCVARGFWYFEFPHPDARFEETGLVLLLPIRIT